MKSVKRIVSLCLMLCMLLSLLPVGAFAEAQSLPENMQFTYINPLYADTVTEWDLVQPGQPLLYADNTGDGQYYDAETAGKMIRDDLVARDPTISVNVSFAYNADTIEQDMQALVLDIMASAMEHTGNPVEGDYLLWQYTGFNVEFGNFTMSGQKVGATATFTMTYHTDAAQEAALDTAVEQLLSQLNVSGKDSYTKLKAIYDYITANITYDYDNLQNNSYKLKHTAYAALINKTAVCQGYAVLLYRLALALGVDCRMIPGNSEGQGHVWNIAKLDGKYYNLDSTWDAGLPIYQCFLKGSDNFPDHDRWDTPGQMPSKDNYNSAEFHAAYPVSKTDYTGGCNHTYIAAVTAPTCTQKGYTTYTCSTCGDTYTGDEVAALGHSWDAGKVTKEPTEEETGVRTYTCTVCGATRTEEIPKLEHTHTYQKAVTAPTCTESGYTTYTCACGDVYTADEVAALGHNEVTDKGYAATCTEEGLTDGVHCDRCGVVLREQEVIAALGHSWDDGEITKEPTEEETGVRTYTCGTCGATRTETIPVLEHQHIYRTVITDPTCTEIGYTTYTCTCGDTYTADEVAALGHNEVTDKGYAATCTEEGLTDGIHCDRCGVVLARQETIPATGHNFENGVCGGCGAEAAVITAQPKTAYAKMGETAKATVKAEGDGLTYQWYIRNADKSKYSKSSVTGPTYSCKMSEKSKDRRALCIITDEYGNEVQTKTIVIREAASIVTEPKTTYAKSGDTAKVTIEASGDGLKYQWYIKNAGSDKYSKSTVKTDTYTVKMSDKVNGRRIRCIVTDKYGNKVETKTVLLRMAATIITQPKDVTAAKGESVQVTVEAVGTDLSYQWYIKNAGKEKFVKSSVTSATYSVKMAKKVHGRELYCVVKDKYGKRVKSDIITLSMS